MNFAFISKNGVPVGPPDPLNRNLSTVTPDPDEVLLMNPGDTLQVILRDTPAGFQVTITDLTTGESGFMSAGAANGFGQIVFDPDTDPLNPKSCQVHPYDFHPMYATSSEHTRVPWAAHSFNVAFSDEIGHFESCDNVTPLFTILGVPIGICTVRIPNDGLRQRDPDDFPCFLALSSSRVPINGCTGTDVDFDGVPYQKVWPGSLTSTRQDRLLNSRPVRFTSPLFFRRTRTTMATEASSGTTTGWRSRPICHASSSPPTRRAIASPVRIARIPRRGLTSTPSTPLRNRPLLVDNASGSSGGAIFREPRTYSAVVQRPRLARSSRCVMQEPAAPSPCSTISATCWRKTPVEWTSTKYTIAITWPDYYRQAT